MSSVLANPEVVDKVCSSKPSSTQYWSNQEKVACTHSTLCYRQYSKASSTRGQIQTDCQLVSLRGCLVWMMPYCPIQHWSSIKYTHRDRQLFEWHHSEIEEPFWLNLTSKACIGRYISQRHADQRLLGIRQHDHWGILWPCPCWLFGLHALCAEVVLAIADAL